MPRDHVRSARETGTFTSAATIAPRRSSTRQKQDEHAPQQPQQHHQTQQATPLHQPRQHTYTLHRNRAPAQPQPRRHETAPVTSAMSSPQTYPPTPHKAQGQTKAQSQPQHPSPHVVMPDYDTCAHGNYTAQSPWIVTTVIEDDDLMFGGKPLCTWYEEDRRRLSVGSASASASGSEAEDDAEEQRGRRRERTRHSDGKASAR